MVETVDLVRLLGTRFVQRKDVKSFQSAEGAWYPSREPMTMADFEAHLSGAKTMGHYLLDTDNNCKFFAFDLDLVKHGRECPGAGCKGCPVLVRGVDGVDYLTMPRQIWHEDHPVVPTLTRELRAMAEGLAWTIFEQWEGSVPIAISASGHKGLHVYALTGTIKAEAAREAALHVLRHFSSVLVPFKGENFWRHSTEYQTLDIEVFPKQTSLDGKELGNLMSLPLGVNRVTGKPKFFITMKGPQDKLVEMDAERVLSGDNPWD